jgi:metal-responsive CopG/Arc/MetJ family transcriptional regulator
MKTAISIPDEIYEVAEKAAGRSGVSRSKFYTRAIEQYLKNQKRKGIKEQLDAVYDQEDSNLDSVIESFQAAVLSGEKW